MRFGGQMYGSVKADPSVIEEIFIKTSGVSTIATTGNTDVVICLPPLPGGMKWRLKSADFVTGSQGLTASDTNYITFSITNKSNSDAAMLATTNYTKATGGTAVTAYTRYGLTISSTAANLVADASDVLLLRAAVTGTLGATMPNSGWTLVFEQRVYN